MTFDELERDEPPFTLAELSEITRRSRTRLLADIESGRLTAFQYLVRPGSPFYVLPEEARAWWQRVLAENVPRGVAPLSPSSPR